MSYYPPPWAYYYPPPPQPRPYQNGYGVAAFTLGLFAIPLSFVPVFGIIAWPMVFLGGMFAIAGLSRWICNRANNFFLTVCGLGLNVAAFMQCVWWVTKHY